MAWPPFVLRRVAMETPLPVNENTLKTGQLSLVEEDAKFQNQFGTKVSTRVKCVYNLDKHQVIDVNIAPRG
jgi:phosphotransferase system IIB component